MWASRIETSDSWSLTPRAHIPCSQVVDPPTLVLDPSSEQASPSSVLQSLSLNSVLGKRENPDFGVDSVWPLKLEAEHDLVGWGRRGGRDWPHRLDVLRYSS